MRPAPGVQYLAIVLPSCALQATCMQLYVELSHITLLSSTVTPLAAWMSGLNSRITFPSAQFTSDTQFSGP